MKIEFSDDIITI